MFKCELCGVDGARIFRDRNEIETLYLCDDCANDVKMLYSLAVSNDSDSYEEFKKGFLEDFNRNRCSRKIVEVAEIKRESVDANEIVCDDSNKEILQMINTGKGVKNNAVKSQKAETVSKRSDVFLPFKLQITTLFAILSLFLPCFGLGLAIISKNMAFEIPVDFSEVDVERARRISVKSFWINLIEIILTVLVVLITLIANS